MLTIYVKLITKLNSYKNMCLWLLIVIVIVIIDVFISNSSNFQVPTINDDIQKLHAINTHRYITNPNDHPHTHSHTYTKIMTSLFYSQRFSASPKSSCHGRGTRTFSQCSMSICFIFYNSTTIINKWTNDSTQETLQITQ